MYMIVLVDDLQQRPPSLIRDVGIVTAEPAVTCLISRRYGDTRGIELQETQFRHFVGNPILLSYGRQHLFLSLSLPAE